MLPAEWLGLEASWQAVHAESLATLRQVSRSQGPSLEPAFLATLPSQALDGLREAEACAQEELGATIAVCVAAILTMIGVATERWLFFAEAKHAVTLYYGQAEV